MSGNPTSESQKTSSLGRFVWRDLMTTDVEGSKKYYSELFGWTTSSHDMGSFGTYTMLHAGGREIGGLVQLDAGQGLPSHWISYISAGDLDAALARVTELGGKVCVPRTEIPGVGWFAVVDDPQGGYFSPYQGLQEGPEEAGPPAPGTFVWNELLTTDPAGAAAFYCKLFGWTTTEHDLGPDGIYTILLRGGKGLGGIMKMPSGADHRPYWLPYVGVQDVDAMAARVEQLGGKIWVPPTDIPGAGRYSVTEDPTGAHIALYKEAGA